jgi:hypothetical protein
LHRIGTMGDSMRPFLWRAVSASLCLMLVSADSESSASWFHKRVIWQAGKEPQVWETTIGSPDGKEHYRLALSPLWAVEGGILGIEILVARPEHPNDNLLGERKTDVPQPFVITVEELENGINESQFGPKRTFKLDHSTLRVEVQGSRLGEGVGECHNCKNIQELILDFACGTSEESRGEVTTLVGWHKVEAGAFSLFAPSGWEFHQLQGIDSYVGEFVGDGIVLNFDFGRYSNPLNEAQEPAYAVVHESIGGSDAKIVSPKRPGHGVTGIYFPKVSSSNKLCLYGQNLTSMQQELVLKIFETIRFGSAVPPIFVPPSRPAKNAQ